MPRSQRRIPTRRRRRRPVRALAVTVVAAFAAVVLTGCEPDPRLEPFGSPGADWTLFYSMNADGLAVGLSWADGSAHAFTHDVNTGVTTALEGPPVSPELPGGGELTNPYDVSESELVVGRVSTPHGSLLAVHDLVDDSWQFPDCPDTLRPGGRGLISNSGLVVCGDRVYDTVTGTDIEVPMPEACEGNIQRVNSHRIAVGACRGGDDPLFATQLDSGVTVGFGADDGFTRDGSHLLTPGTFDDAGWFVVSEEFSMTPRTAVYRIPPDLSQEAPESIDLGALGEGLSHAWAISPGGLLALDYVVGDTVISGTYNVVTGRLRTWDTSDLPGDPSGFANFVVGITDDYAAVGFRVVDTYEAFAVGPDDHARPELADAGD